MWSVILFRPSLIVMGESTLRIQVGNYGGDLRGSKLEIPSDIYYRIEYIIIM